MLAEWFASACARAREKWPELPDDMRLRLRRALSWCKRAAAEEDDPDARFLFLWIAFNAAYGTQPPETRREQSDREVYQSFVRRLVELEDARWRSLLEDVDFRDAVKKLLNNPWVDHGFWEAVRASGDPRWKHAWREDQKRAEAAWHRGDAARVLSLVLDRLYVLRNQLVHGGATWQGSVNRAQVEDGAWLMEMIVPAVVETLLAHPDENWGEPWYPPVDKNARRMPYRWPKNAPC